MNSYNRRFIVDPRVGLDYVDFTYEKGGVGETTYTDGNSFYTVVVEFLEGHKTPWITEMISEVYRLAIFCVFSNL